MMTVSSALTALNTDIVNARTAITNKGGTVTSGGGSSQLATDIATIPSGGSAPVITSLNVTPTTSAQTITAPSGTDGYSPVNVAAVTASIDSNITAGNIKKDVQILGVTGSYEGSGGGSTGKYALLDRVEDDNGNEIGTVSGFFTDVNNVEYAVVCLDAQYRLNRAYWLASRTTITNLPMTTYTSYLYDFNTATFNTQTIIDSGYTSDACNHCRSKSFTIDGVTYYGQLPNISELIDTIYNMHYINYLDPTSDYNNYGNVLSWLGQYWSSTQINEKNALYFNSGGYSCVGNTYKNSNKMVVPILEIPNRLNLNKVSLFSWQGDNGVYFYLDEEIPTTSSNAYYYVSNTLGVSDISVVSVVSNTEIIINYSGWSGDLRATRNNTYDLSFNVKRR